ncbi:hypothetical protein FRC18_003207 [Serendipita sp. 400]|nr:hypothetical protein FRC18_003207 [Serendipita sp. 400]
MERPERSIDDAMDIDEVVLNEVVNLRASRWKSTNEQIPDTNGAAAHKTSVEFSVVLDSNVLISYLPLLRDLLSSIQRQALKMALCLPAVVVAELNYLKEKNGNPNTRALAQEANVWLLAQMRQRQGTFRGQQKHEKGNLEYDTQSVNDDKIVDYCQYLSSTTATVVLLSNDQNCCLKAEIQGIKTISPKAGTAANDLIFSIMGSVPYHASLGPTNGKQEGGYQHKGLMDIDDDGFVAASDIHPLSVLHRQLVEYLTALLQQLAFDVALKEQSRREKTGSSPTTPKPLTGKASIYSSMHAPKKADPQVLRRAFVMPTSEDVQMWSAPDCIIFSIEFPPVSDGVQTKTDNRSQPTVTKLKLFLLSHDKPGGRKGKDWSIGDWKMALEELEKVAAYCGWSSVHECVEICRGQLQVIYPPS